MLNKSSKILFTILLSSLLSSCGTVKLKDGRVCGDMGRFGATCDNVLTDKPVDIPQPEWDQVRVGQLCMDSALFANWKASLMKLCNDTKRCTREEEQAIKVVGERLKRLHLKTSETLRYNVE